MTILGSFSEWFWNPDVWLPPGFGWKDVEPNETVKYTNSGDLFYPIPTALCIICMRLIVERTILRPWGRWLGLPQSNKTFSSLPHIDVLEESFRKSRRKLSAKEVAALAKRTDLEVRQIERWLRRRLAKDKHTKLAKFSECGWRCICYSASVILGLIVLWDKSWIWDINFCWYNYPHHSIPDGVWWYYTFGTGIYWSLLITQFFDAKRKDFWEMFLHHLTTIGLLSFSWVCNFTRVGTLVLLVHDFADVFLEAGKMCKYAKYDKVGDVISLTFVATWFVTRLGVFPFHILTSTLSEAPKIIPMFSAYYIFNGMLLTLLALHMFWTYYILKVAVRAIETGKIEETRSSTEESVSEFSGEEEDNNAYKSSQKGNEARTKS